MRSGRLRHTVTIEQDTSSEGEQQPHWTPWRSAVPCRVEHVRGDEKAQRDDQAEAVFTHRVTLRHVSGMLPTMRMDYYGKILNIVDISEDGLEHEMVLLCREKAA